jgi:antitoxin component of MazEF toxin-antitoxin module
MSKLQKFGNSLLVCVPRYIIIAMKWHKGDTLMFNIDQRSGKVILERLKSPTLENEFEKGIQERINEREEKAKYPWDN